MQEIKAVATFVFRVDKDQYYFYSVKRGPHMPYLPYTWTPIASIISSKDIELCDKIRKKHGDISENMEEKVTILRQLLERNLILDPELNISLSASLDVRQQILEMDQVHLNVMFHSLVPSGYRTMLVDEQHILTHYYLFASPASGYHKGVNLCQYSDYLYRENQLPEEDGKWFKAAEIVKKREHLNELIDDAYATLMHHFYVKKKKLVETARAIENRKSKNSMVERGLFPYIWRFKTPAHTPRPYSESNIYVIGNQKKYIIDPGSSEKRNLNFLTDFIDNNLDTMEGILISNPLVDHVNQAICLKDEYNLPIYSSKINAEVLEDEGFSFTSYLDQGSKIDLGSYEPMNLDKWQMETLELPGYTPGQIGFYDPRGIVFVSSLFHKNMVSYIDSYPGAYDDLMTSYDRISKLKAKFALSGHRDQMINPNQTISENKKQFSKYESVVVQQLRSGKTSVDKIYMEVQKQAQNKYEVLSRNITLVILAKLIEENKVSKRGDDYFWLKNTIEK